LPPRAGFFRAAGFEAFSGLARAGARRVRLETGPVRFAARLVWRRVRRRPVGPVLSVMVHPALAVVWLLVPRSRRLYVIHDTTPHPGRWWDLRWRLIRRLDRSLAARSATVVALSAWAADDWRRDHAPEGQRVTDLARVINDSSSCITHRVNRLAEAGLVQKFTDPDDQRVRRVELTAAGRSLLTLAAPDHARRVRRWVIDPLSARDIADLARVTRRLNDHLRATEPATGSQRNVAVVSRPSS